MFTDEEFEDLMSYDPLSNKKQTHAYLIRQINNKAKTFRGEEIDFKFISKKYKEYASWWNRTNQNKDPKYIGKAGEKKSLQTFLSLSMFEGDYGIGKSPRDFYMLGDLSFTDFENLTNRFKNLIDKRNPELLEKSRDSFKDKNYGKPTESKTELF